MVARCSRATELRQPHDTLVAFTTDNGAEKFTWPDGGTSPFRGEVGVRASVSRGLAGHHFRSREGLLGEEAETLVGA